MQTKLSYIVEKNPSLGSFYLRDKLQELQTQKTELQNRTYTIQSADGCSHIQLTTRDLWLEFQKQLSSTKKGSYEQARVIDRFSTAFESPEFERDSKRSSDLLKELENLEVLVEKSYESETNRQMIKRLIKNNEFDLVDALSHNNLELKVVATKEAFAQQKSEFAFKLFEEIPIPPALQDLFMENSINLLDKYPEKHPEVIFYFIKKERPDLAIELIKQRPLSLVNTQILLEGLCILGNSLEILSFLIEQDSYLIVLTVLTLFRLKKHKEAVEFLLEKKSHLSPEQFGNLFTRLHRKD